MTFDTTKTAGGSLRRGWLDFARYHLGNRWVLLALGGLLLIIAGALNWGWLVAAGIAPVLVAVAPCAIMCALGLCGMKMMSGSNAAQDSPAPRSQLTDESSASTEGAASSADHLLSCCQGGAEASLPDKPADNSQRSMKGELHA
jgi:hypothetical protein